MKLVLALGYGAIVLLLALTAWLYPSVSGWAVLGAGFSLWFGVWSFILATRKLLVAAQISGYCINGLAMLASLAALGGYAGGQAKRQ